MKLDTRLVWTIAWSVHKAAALWVLTAMIVYARLMLATTVPHSTVLGGVVLHLRHRGFAKWRLLLIVQAIHRRRLRHRYRARHPHLVLEKRTLAHSQVTAVQGLPAVRSQAGVFRVILTLMD